MFIRWIVRKHKNEYASHITFHDAYLVESYRDKNGNPRQRTISYLGNLRQVDHEFPIIERKLFLSQVSFVLQHMPELSTYEQEKIIEQLHQTVPPLTKEEMLLILRQNLHFYGQWFHPNGHELPSPEELHHLIKSSEQPLEPLLNFATLSSNRKQTITMQNC